MPSSVSKETLCRWQLNRPTLILEIGWHIKVSLPTVLSYVQRLTLGTHLAVEQYRLITYFIVSVQEVNQNTNTVVCNANECPTMSAGRLVIATHEPYPSQQGS